MHCTEFTSTLRCFDVFTASSGCLFLYITAKVTNPIKLINLNFYIHIYIYVYIYIYIHGSVHRESNLITVQQDATYSVYFSAL